MSIGSIQSDLIAFSIFDAYMAGLQKLNQANRPIASPLIDAAFKAFEGYIATVEVQHSAMIAGAAIYALNPKGGVNLITKSQMAPFLALNILAG